MFFLIVMRTFKIYSQQLSNIKYSFINCSQHAVHCISLTYSFCNWTFVPPLSVLPTSCHLYLATDKLFSVSVSLVFFFFFFGYDCVFFRFHI